MTNTTFSSTQELSSMNESQELPLQDFIYKGNYGVPDHNVPTADLPVIDVGQLLQSDQELDKLRSALTTWGCFQVVNHGVTSSLLDKMRQINKQFFALPMADKQKYSREVGSLEGYGNGMAVPKIQTPNWSDGLVLVLSPEDKRQSKFWPRNPEDFRETLDEYYLRILEVNEIVFKAMARSLNVEENCFLKQCGKRPRVSAVFNFYPPCPRPDLIYGSKPHTDGSALTILLQDEEVDGLQVLKEGQWFKVPILPHALLVNTGEQIEIISNGIFPSVLHRVVTNSEKGRNTMGVFFSPDQDIDIGPVNELVTETRPVAYKKVRYLEDVFLQYVLQGKRLIDAVKI